MVSPNYFIKCLRPSLVEYSICRNSCIGWYIHKYVSDPPMVTHHSLICDRLYLQKAEHDISFGHIKGDGDCDDDASSLPSSPHQSQHSCTFVVSEVSQNNLFPSLSYMHYSLVTLPFYNDSIIK